MFLTFGIDGRKVGGRGVVDEDEGDDGGLGRGVTGREGGGCI